MARPPHFLQGSTRWRLDGRAKTSGPRQQSSQSPCFGPSHSHASMFDIGIFSSDFISEDLAYFIAKSPWEQICATSAHTRRHCLPHTDSAAIGDLKPVAGCHWLYIRGRPRILMRRRNSAKASPRVPSRPGFSFVESSSLQQRLHQTRAKKKRETESGVRRSPCPPHNRCITSTLNPSTTPVQLIASTPKNRTHVHEYTISPKRNYIFRTQQPLATMRYMISATVAFGATLVAAQSAADIPSCALPCFINNIPKVTSCTVLDTACQCTLRARLPLNVVE